MTVFHIIGYWFLALFCITLLSGITWLLCDVLVLPLWKRMIRVRDIYVLNWWIKEIEATGHKIPTKANVDKLMARVKQITDELEEGSNEDYI